MSYSPPDIDAIVLQSGYSPADIDNVTISSSMGSDTTATVAALVIVAVTVEGIVSAVGTAAVSVPIAAYGIGHHGVKARADVTVPTVGSAIANFGGQFTAVVQAEVAVDAKAQGALTVSGAVTGTVGVSASGVARYDWTWMIDPPVTQEVYRLIVTGAADGLESLTIPISSWQATAQAGDRSSYLQATIPAVMNLVDALQARSNGELILQKGFRFEDGTALFETIVRSDFSDFRFDRGPSRATGTVSGYRGGIQESTGEVVVQGVRSISLAGGKYRVRCDIDLFLRPGMTVLAGGESFKAAYINYYANDVDRFCEIGERAL